MRAPGCGEDRSYTTFPIPDNTERSAIPSSVSGAIALGHARPRARLRRFGLYCSPPREDTLASSPLLQLLYSPNRVEGLFSGVHPQARGVVGMLTAAAPEPEGGLTG